MLDAGVFVDCHNDNGVTALVTAAINNYTKVIETLLHNKANINAQTATGVTALHRAAWRNSTDAISLLLRHGADVNIKDKKGRTPVEWARLYNQKEAEDLLKKHRKSASWRYSHRKPETFACFKLNSRG